MKLRNKKTGEIIEVNNIYTFAEDKHENYNSLKEFNEVWEDYEETKDHWHLGCEGDIFIDNTERYLKSYSLIGNDFETKEEAEKAVEKLKAWKRLKDIGCSFDGWNVKSASSEGDHLLINLYVKDCTGCEDILDLLFGGEE